MTILRIVLLAVLLSLVPTRALAEFHLFEMQETSLDYTWFNGGSRWFPINQLPGHDLTNALNLNVNFVLAKYFFMNNTVHTMIDSTNGGMSQFRTVGWEYNLGVHITPWADISMFHHSEHVLDTDFPAGGYLQETGVMLKVYLYKRAPANSVF